VKEEAKEYAHSSSSIIFFYLLSLSLSSSMSFGRYNSIVSREDEERGKKK
jgi:hypothetical protein